MEEPKICDCSGKLNLDVEEIIFTADICPGCISIDSCVSLKLDTLSFNSKKVNLPDYFFTVKGSGLSVSGNGILTLHEDMPGKDTSVFYVLFLFESAYVKQNLASITFFNIDGIGAITAYSITFVAKQVNLKVTHRDTDPSEVFSFPVKKDIGKDIMIIVKDGQVEVREL